MAQNLGRLFIGLFMLAAGIAHLSFLEEAFHAQVPTSLPMDKGLAVTLSGWVEIALGASMLFLSRYKVWVGLALAFFFIVIFPGNLSQYLNGIDAFGLDSDRKRLIRLFFQPVFILWALWASGALSELRRQCGKRGS